MAEPYLKDIDFAFFVVHFGYTKSDYEQLTPREIAFVRKEWENKMISDSYINYNAIFKATYNVQRKKGKKALKLWQKVQVRKADMGVIENNLKIVKEVEQNEGKSWVERLYRENNMPYREVKKNV